MSPPPLSWTVTLDFVNEGEVELSAYLNGEDRRPGSERCSLPEALRQLEVLFACTADADFSLAVRTSNGPWRHLSTRRWRLALYFVTAQYESAFVGRVVNQGEHRESTLEDASEATDAREPSVAEEVVR